jgi:hypothetical protein
MGPGAGVGALGTTGAGAATAAGGDGGVAGGFGAGGTSPGAGGIGAGLRTMVTSTGAVRRSVGVSSDMADTAGTDSDPVGPTGFPEQAADPRPTNTRDIKYLNLII